MIPEPDWKHVAAANGYLVVCCVGHPRARPKGHYVYVHVLIAEQRLGRFLHPWEVAHHIDGNKRNNRPDNIEVMSRKIHSRHHAKKPARVTLPCGECGRPVVRLKRRLISGKPVFCNHVCAGRKNGHRKTPEFRHGTASAYNYRKCRCLGCRAFMAAEARERRARKKRPLSS
jgi:hypothetical protein